MGRQYGKPFSALCEIDMLSCDGVVMCRAGNTYDFVPAPDEDDDGYYDIKKCEDGNLGWCNAGDIAEHFEEKVWDNFSP